MGFVQIDDPFNSTLIQQGLNTRRFGRHIVYHETIGSTNDAALALADENAPEGTAVISDEQTAGRGRMARTWLAPPRSSILMSLVLYPPLAPSGLGKLPTPFALGCCQAIRLQTGLDARIKWPNDLLIRGKKCAGILAEAKIAGNVIEYAVVGLGLNVNFRASLVQGIPGDATTLSDELGRRIPRAALVRSILEHSEHYYARLCAGDALREDWKANASTVGQRVHAFTPWGEEQGVAEDIDDDGALWLRRPDGSRVRLVAGDVTLHGS